MLVVFFQQFHQHQKFLQRSMVILGIVIIITIIVQEISLQVEREIRKILLGMLITFHGCLIVFQQQIDASQTHIQGCGLLLRHLERIGYEQRLSIPKSSLGQVVVEDIGISQIGTDIRHQLWGIAVPEQFVCLMIERDDIFSLLMKVMIIACLTIVGISQETVSARRFRLMLGKGYDRIDV